MPPRASGHQPSQDSLGQGLVVGIDGHTRVLEKPLDALLEAVAGAGQGQRRNNLADLQALAAQDAQGDRGQIHHTGERCQGQIVVQLYNQVGKHLVLWFDHRCLRGRGWFLRGYECSQPSLRRLLPSHLLCSCVCSLLIYATKPSLEQNRIAWYET